MLANESKTFAEKASAMMEAFNARPLTERALTAWFTTLMEFPARDVFVEMDDVVRRLNKPPTCADLWKTLNERRSTRLENDARDRQRAEKQEVAELFSGRSEYGLAMLEQLRQIAQPRTSGDRRAWAMRIMEKVASGDRSVPHVSIEFARRALQWSVDDVRAIVDGGVALMPPVAERVPGEDDE